METGKPGKNQSGVSYFQRFSEVLPVFLIFKWVKGPGSTKSRSLSKERQVSWCPVLSSDAFPALLAISSLLTFRFRETFWAIHRMIFFHGGKLSDWAHPFCRNPWREIISFLYDSRFLAESWSYLLILYLRITFPGHPNSSPWNGGME